MTLSRFQKFASLFSLLALSATLAFAGQPIVGSSNTAFAEAPIPTPKTTPCAVTLFAGDRFAGFNAQPFSYTPPANCPAPWAKVILVADFSVSKGIQYDRTANIWIGPTNIYFGTTSEPDPNDSRHWQVERDLTDYSSIFTVPQEGAVDLGNIFNKTYTGLLHGTATVYFYPVPQGAKAPVSADEVIGFSGGPIGGTVGLGNSGSLLEQTLTLPTNVERVFFDVFAQSQSGDEFWYTCVPNDVAGELESCGGTAFREAEVAIDGTPAGVAPVYPWIYTGGIDPYLWFPIPGVQTMNFRPHRVDLTPFAGQLDDGNPHTIALSVFNANNYFSATASLLLYLDHGSTQVTGGVTQNTLAAPSPAITEKITTAGNGNLTGTVSTTSGHNFQISGYVNTSHGPVTNTVAQNINFSNVQKFSITGSTYVQDINQITTIDSTFTIVNSNGTYVSKYTNDWPLIADISLVFNSDGTIDQTTSINQSLSQNERETLNGKLIAYSELHNAVTPTDTLIFDSNFNLLGNENQSSAQTFYDYNLSGFCYSESLTAANNVITSVTNGAGCN